MKSHIKFSVSSGAGCIFKTKIFRNFFEEKENYIKNNLHKKLDSQSIKKEKKKKQKSKKPILARAPNQI